MFLLQIFKRNAFVKKYFPQIGRSYILTMTDTGMNRLKLNHFSENTLIINTWHN